MSHLPSYLTITLSVFVLTQESGIMMKVDVHVNMLKS